MKRQLEIQVPALRVNEINFICNHSPWDPEEIGKSRLELSEERLGLVALEREMRGQSPESLC